MARGRQQFLYGPEVLKTVAARIAEMAEGLDGGTLFMADYTCDLEPGKEVPLGAHMLEVCPSIAVGKPRIGVHPLGIGGRELPARLVFEDWAEMMGIEYVHIGKDTTVEELKKELFCNDVAWKLKNL